MRRAPEGVDEGFDEGFFGRERRFLHVRRRAAWCDLDVEAFFEVLRAFMADSSLGVFKVSLKPAFHHNPHNLQPLTPFSKVLGEKSA